MATHRRNSVVQNPVNFVPSFNSSAFIVDLLDDLLDDVVWFLHTLNFSVTVLAAVPLQSVDVYDLSVTPSVVHDLPKLREPNIRHALFLIQI